MAISIIISKMARLWPANRLPLPNPAEAGEVGVLLTSPAGGGGERLDADGQDQQTGARAADITGFASSRFFLMPGLFDCVPHFREAAAGVHCGSEGATLHLAAIGHGRLAKAAKIRLNPDPHWGTIVDVYLEREHPHVTVTEPADFIVWSVAVEYQPIVAVENNDIAKPRARAEHDR